MSLKDFQTYLVPATKTAAIPFRQKPTVDFPQGRILDAAFSRPNGGSTVFNAQGQLVENGEDVPDWSFENGCPVLKMRQQLENLMYYTDPASLPVGPSNIVNVSFAANDWGIGLNGKVIFSDNSVTRAFDAGGPTVGSTWYTLGFIIKPSDGLAPSFGLGSSDIGSIRVANAVQSNPFVVKIENIGNGLFFCVLSGIRNGDSGTYSDRFGITKSTTNNNVGFEVSAFIGVEGQNVDLQLSDYIPNMTGAPLTRSANLVRFKDLVNQGVIGAGSVGSVVIKIDQYDVSNSTPLTSLFQEQVSLNSFQNRFDLVARGTGLTPFAYQGAVWGATTSAIFLNANQVIVYVFNGQNIKAYNSSGLVSNFDSPTYAGDIDTLALPLSSAGGTIGYKFVALTPYILSESKAIAACVEAQNL